MPGELKPADLMTKHLGGAKRQSNVKILNIEFLSGRADKAAHLHNVGGKNANGMIDGELGKLILDAFDDKFVDKRGG